VAGLYILFRWHYARKKRKRTLESGIREIDVMQGVEFEQYLRALFETAGFRVDMTPGSGDFGADLVLRKNGRTIVVQAKRYHRTVGIDAVQAVHASASYYRADESWVVTNKDFSPAARELAAKSRVRLINRNELIGMITNLRRNNISG
jgi:restriction system protein